MKKNRSPSRVIRPARFKAHLAGLDLPYTVYQQPPFRLEPALMGYEYKHKSEVRAVTPSRQLEYFDQAVARLRRPDESSLDGWTMCLAGEVHLGVMEATAAYMAGVALQAGKDVLWLDMANVFKHGVYEIWGTPQLQMVSRPPRLVVITGLTSSSAPMRWSRATDILRSTTRSMCRIVVCAGYPPPETMKHLHMPYHYAVCLGKPVTTH